MAAQICFCTLICSGLIFHICGILSYLLGTAICYEELVFHISHTFVSLVDVLAFVCLFLAFHGPLAPSTASTAVCWDNLPLTVGCYVFTISLVVLELLLSRAWDLLPYTVSQKVGYCRFPIWFYFLSSGHEGSCIHSVWLRYTGWYEAVHRFIFTWFLHIELGPFKYRIAMLYEITVELCLLAPLYHTSFHRLQIIEMITKYYPLSVPLYISMYSPDSLLILRLCRMLAESAQIS